MVAFPAFKLGALMIKQIAKPLANIAKARAKQSPFFRNYICMPPAQFYHWCDVKLKMWSMNLGKPVNIPKLNESSAIELGAELVGEAFIFGIASGILIFEYVRSSRKDAVKEAERLAQMERIQNDLKTLYIQNNNQGAQIRELIRILEEKMPDSNFSPEPFSEYSIPEHHRDYDPPEEVPGTFTVVKGWIFNAIDYVLPTDNTVESQPRIILVQTKSEPDNCKCDDNVAQSTSSKVDKTSLESNNNKQDPNR